MDYDLTLISNKKRRSWKKKWKKVGVPIKDFLDKPMYDLTVGDTLLLGACTTLLSIVISVSAQGWMNILSKNSQK